MIDTFDAVHGITGLDTRMAGKAGLTSAYLVESFAPTLVETGPATSTDTVIATLGRLGIAPADLAHIVVTHIHLDHAGGIGAIARHFHRATVWVHPVGARHLADPGRLNDSAERAYGAERLAALFGRMSSVLPDRIRTLEDGDSIDLGSRRLTALHTPGHASHHLALQDSETGAVFTGDAVGVHLPGVNVLQPAAPPPEFDMELAIGSIERIARHARGTLLFSHYGPTSGVEAICADATSQIRSWAEIVRLARARSDDVAGVADTLRRATAADFADVSGIDRDRFEALGGFDLNAAGLLRYWQKRENATTS